MRKVERLVNLVALLLDTRRPLTLDQVAELVPGYQATGESLRRMFERDKEELRGLGVPFERGPVDAWGNEEGYFIDPKAYAMPRLDLAPDERAALALAARAWSGAAGEPAALAGLAKLDLDPGAGPDAVRANLGGASPLLASLLEAVTSRKRVLFSYRPPGRQRSERNVEPYALIHRRGTWYVVGHDSDRGGLRSFRLSRIQSGVRMARPASRGPEFEVPDWFDPSDALPAAGEPDASPAASVRAGEHAAASPPCSPGSRRRTPRAPGNGPLPRDRAGPRGPAPGGRRGSGDEPPRPGAAQPRVERRRSPAAPARAGAVGHGPSGGDRRRGLRALRHEPRGARRRPRAAVRLRGPAIRPWRSHGGVDRGRPGPHRPGRLLRPRAAPDLARGRRAVPGRTGAGHPAGAGRARRPHAGARQARGGGPGRSARPHPGPRQQGLRGSGGLGGGAGAPHRPVAGRRRRSQGAARVLQRLARGADPPQGRPLAGVRQLRPLVLRRLLSQGGGRAAVPPRPPGLGGDHRGGVRAPEQLRPGRLRRVALGDRLRRGSRVRAGPGERGRVGGRLLPAARQRAAPGRPHARAPGDPGALLGRAPGAAPGPGRGAGQPAGAAPRRRRRDPPRPRRLRSRLTR